MSSKLAALLLCFALWGCRDSEPDIVIVTQTVFLPGGPTDIPTPSPSPSVGPVSRVTLGCFGMLGPDGNGLPGCGVNLETYFAPAGTEGILDATPLDPQGNRVQGLSVEAWASTGACAVTGETSGPDGFNPDIRIDLGTCVVTVRVAGVTGGPRLFIGQ